jgi:hypothetical protein
MADGFCVLRGFFNREIVDTVRTGVGRLVDDVLKRLKSEGTIEDVCTGHPLETRLLEACRDKPDAIPLLFRKELHIAEMFDLFFHPDLLDLMLNLTGSYPFFHCSHHLVSSLTTVTLRDRFG